MTQNKNNQFRSGMVAIVGRPNTGKSTLLNEILEEKVAIVSKVPQTTRNQIRGIYNDERGQIVFIDTPGLHLGKDKLADFMNQSSSGTLHDTDCIIYLVDTSRQVGEEEQYIADKLKLIKTPIIMGLNKIDLKGKYLSQYIELWERTKGKPITEMEKFHMIALSGQKGTNLKELLDTVFNFLPEGPALYPTDIISDTPQKMVIADIIREKFFSLMKEEIPHSLGVLIEEMTPVKKKTLLIKVLVFVERDSQKEIVIGRKGEILKQIGIAARRELEELLNKRIFLEFYVKAEKHWRDDISLLQELGYFNI